VETEILVVLGVVALIALAVVATKAAHGRASQLEVVPVPQEVPRLRLLRSDEEVQAALDGAMESERAAARLSERRTQHYSILREQLRPAAGQAQVSPRSGEA
jgi:hypothetical protein